MVVLKTEMEYNGKYNFMLTNITLTRPYYEHPGKPHVIYREKWDSQGFILFVLFYLKNIGCGCLLEPPYNSNEHPQPMFGAKLR